MKMDFTPTTFKALEISCIAHDGQKDLAGKPYILHPLYVANRVKTEEEQIVALLHDVLEDSKITVDDLREYFDENIVDAILLLTRNPKEDYQEYIERLAANPIARHVKIADLDHNMDLTRLTVVKKADLRRMERYHKAWRYLKTYEKRAC